MSSSVVLGSLGDLAAGQHGVVTRRRAGLAGYGRNAIARLIARGVLVEPVPGVLVVAGSPPTWRRRLVVATLACREQGLAIGASAARLHGLDGFETSEVVHVALPRGRAIRLEDVLVSQTLHTYPREDRYQIDGIACAGLARVICDIAPHGRDVLERAVDDFQRRGHSLVWLERTASTLRARGRPAIADVLAEVERRAQDPAVRGSWFERLVEECLQSPGLPGLKRQHEIRDANGQFIARVDLAIPAVRLAIEAHSRKFHTGPVQERRDEEREALATEEGWQFEYVGWRRVEQTPAAVRTHIERVVARRASDLGIDLGSI